MRDYINTAMKMGELLNSIGGSHSLAKEILGSNHRVESAGSIPSGEVHPNAIATMKEIGIDISNQTSKSIESLDKEFVNKLDHVITLCAEEVCPIVPKSTNTLHWPNEDVVHPLRRI